jgi:hypothetical protein
MEIAHKPSMTSRRDIVPQKHPANAVASLALAGLAMLSACAPATPRQEYAIKSPNGLETALFAIEPNWSGYGTTSLTFLYGDGKPQTYWSITNLYRAKLGWLNDDTFAVIGDEIVIDQEAGPHVKSDDITPLKLEFCIRVEKDCSALERRLKPGTKYVPNFQAHVGADGNVQLPLNSTAS